MCRLHPAQDLRDLHAAGNHHDTGRIPQSLEFVQRTTARLGAAAGARRLEVGAGTGQLTGSLLAAGGELVAVEPALPLAECLERNYRRDAGGRAPTGQPPGRRLNRVRRDSI